MDNYGKPESIREAINLFLKGFMFQIVVPRYQMSHFHTEGFGMWCAKATYWTFAFTVACVYATVIGWATISSCKWLWNQFIG